MRKPLWFTLGYGCACALGAYFYTKWLILPAVLAFVTAIAALFLYRRFAFMKQTGMIALGLAVGIALFGVYHYFYLSPVVELDGVECELTATASDYSYATDYGSVAEVRLPINNRKYKALVYLRQANSISPGDELTGSFRLRVTHGGEDDATYHRGEGIFLLAYATDDCKVSRAESLKPAYYPAMWRREILHRIEQLFPEDTAFFAKALLLGDRTDMDYQTNTALKVSGISHVVAVSGLHISILFSLIGFMTGKRRVLVTLFGIPILLAFAAIAGFTPSITRACCMQILMMLATLLDRDYDSPIALSVVSLLMLVCNPLVITSVSFQLSVGCMAGIILFGEPIRAWIIHLPFWSDWRGMPPKKRLRNWLASSVSVTVSAMTFTTPLVVVYFETVSLVSILTNLLTLWVVNWIFYGILLVCLLSLVWTPLASVLAWLLSWFIRYVLGVAKVLAGFPLAAVYTKSIYIIFWVIFCYVLLIVYLALSGRKPEISVCCSIVALCISLVLSWAQPVVNECSITMLDVGQGQCIILQANGRTFLVDCGGDSDALAADMAAETLLSMGIFRLDGVILTHYDRDHAGGLCNLLSRIRAEGIYLPRETDDTALQQDILEECGSPFFVDKDIELSWQTGSLRIFAPVAETSDNESGLCVLFREGNCDILITGDMSISSENRLLLRKEIPELTILVAGHHGSKYSTGESLLSATSPEYVMISAGENNTYGHPNDETLTRIAAYGCAVLRTDRDGTIVYRR